MLQDPDFRAQMRRAVEFNAADRNPGAARGQFVWFTKRLVESVAPARERGIARSTPRRREPAARAPARGGLRLGGHRTARSYGPLI
ncbi:hypothetical protein [Streptomyces sp. NPDC018693]|uniref:hypothetical protein n=1 Tax=unclassified Streptomyces TaxID=2593676 RepID=UPI00378DB228